VPILNRGSRARLHVHSQELDPALTVPGLEETMAEGALRVSNSAKFWRSGVSPVPGLQIRACYMAFPESLN
jgi:hypothetical protein